MEESKSMWFGGADNNLYLHENKLRGLPTIEKLAKDYNIFQNSPYYGEFNQKKSMTYGDVKDLLRDIAILFKETDRM